MPELPTLETARLRLRPFTLADAADVQRLAGDREVASTTRLVPHPYEDGLAEPWISSIQEKFDRGEQITLAIADLQNGELMGCVGLVISQDDRRAELGYWVGKPFWGRGICTEASQAMLSYGFGTLGMNRVFAHHMVRNPASGRVLEKLGMRREGHLRQHNRKWGKYEDLHVYGILRSEFSDEENPGGADA